MPGSRYRETGDEGIGSAAVWDGRPGQRSRLPLPSKGQPVRPPTAGPGVKSPLSCQALLPAVARNEPCSTRRVPSESREAAQHCTTVSA